MLEMVLKPEFLPFLILLFSFEFLKCPAEFEGHPSLLLRGARLPFTFLRCQKSRSQKALSLVVLKDSPTSFQKKIANPCKWFMLNHHLRGGAFTDEIDGAEAAAKRLDELKTTGSDEHQWLTLLNSCIALAQAGDLTCARRAIDVLSAMAELGMRSPLETREAGGPRRPPAATDSPYERLFDICERAQLLPESLRLLALHERSAPRGALLARAGAVLDRVAERLDERGEELDELAAAGTLADDDGEAWEVANILNACLN